MRDLILQPTDVTPTVKFIQSNGLLEISGKAMPEDSFKFFNPLLRWLEGYKVSAPSKTLLELKMDYFNTSSEIFILKIIKSVAELKNSGNDVVINWYYKTDDDEMEYTGRYLGKLGEFPMEIIAY